MATGASTADLAVVLVDARKGVLHADAASHATSSRCSGIRHVLLAVNKMDLVGYAQDVFEHIAGEYARSRARAESTDPADPDLGARRRQHLVQSSARMPWYGGPTVLGYLETVDVSLPRESRPFRMPVQWINRPGPDFRGCIRTRRVPGRCSRAIRSAFCRPASRRR